MDDSSQMRTAAEGRIRRLSRHLRMLTAASLLIPAAFTPICAEADLPAETTTGPDTVVTVPTPYPASYAVVHNFSFAALIDSSFGLVDSKTGHFKGMMSAGQFATLAYSAKRQKFYVGETVHSRGNRGTREDLIAVYDFANLKLQKDIVIPARRANSVVLKASTGITSDDRFLIVYNMNPAMSVTVVDLDSETVAGEIETPGCALAYPDARGGFFQLCGDGKLMHITLDARGALASRTPSEVFNDIDADPLSEKASLIGNSWYFITYQGEVQPIDASRKHPQIGSRWWLTSNEERAANWRPAGWHGTAGHESGHLYVAMTPNGYHGSHKDPALEVWTFDVAKKQRTARITLQTPALSIAVTAGSSPQLLVLNAAGGMDVYDVATGKWQRTVQHIGSAPMMVHAVGDAN